MLKTIRTTLLIGIPIALLVLLAALILNIGHAAEAQYRARTATTLEDDEVWSCQSDYFSCPSKEALITYGHMDFRKEGVDDLILAGNYAAWCGGYVTIDLADQEVLVAGCDK